MVVNIPLHKFQDNICPIFQVNFIQCTYNLDNLIVSLTVSWLITWLGAIWEIRNMLREIYITFIDQFVWEQIGVTWSNDKLSGGNDVWTILCVAITFRLRDVTVLRTVVLHKSIQIGVEHILNTFEGTALNINAMTDKFIFGPSVSLA